MSRPTPLSGFPEWVPSDRVVEQTVLDTLRRVFELHGFASVETRAVEPLSVLLSKGEIDKEVYVVRRLHDDADAADDDSLALHFDLTVPFARYVVEHAGKLDFPFRRYQIQKVWRGERPQEGRFREFVQADVDVVARDTLPLHYEVELPLVIADAFAALPLPPVRLHANNRKLAEGFYRGIGVDDTAGVLRAVDKLDKVGAAGVRSILVDEVGLTDKQVDACLALAEIRTEDASFVDQVRALGASDPLLDEGLEELAAVVDGVRAVSPGALVADLKIARGLDYYTGTVYETTMAGHEDLGSVCSGGRYDNLASSGDVRFPGTGLSIGVSRLLSRLLARGAVTASRPVPTCVLVAVPDEESRGGSMQVATALRGRGIAAEVAPAAAKYGKQIRYADRRGIPYVWFPGESGDEVKDIRSGEQKPADAATWTPPAEDLRPAVREETA